MANLFSILEFIIIFVFLILPSLLVSESPDGTVLNFSHGYKIVVFILFLAAILVFAIEKKVFDGKGNDRLFRCACNDEKVARNVGKSATRNDRESPAQILLKIGNGTLCFGLILVVASVFEAIGFFAGGSFNQDEIIFPQNAFYFANFIFGTFAAAFTEEIFYRFYLPEALKRNFNILTFGKLDSEKKLNKNCHSESNEESQKKDISLPLNMTDFFFELTAVLIFAFSHRYLGILAVLNAFFDGAILRFCMARTKSVFVPAAVHFIYNLCVLAAIRLL